MTSPNWLAQVTPLLTASLRSPILWALLVIDLVLIIVHLLVALSPNEEVGSWTDFLRVDKDRSLSEWFEFTKLGFAILLLVRHARRQQHRAGYLMVAALLALMLFDNIVEVRLHTAEWLAPGRLATAELVLVSATAPFLAGLMYLAFRGAKSDERSELAAILIVLAVFALFAVVIDFLHEVALMYGPTIYGGLSVLEDGGELITLSLLLALVIHLTRSPLGRSHGNGLGTPMRDPLTPSDDLG
jgi:hypothetical protein